MKKSPPALLLAILCFFAGVSLSSALDVTARYFRFTQTKLRDGLSANSIQLSEFEMLYQGNRLAGATATNPGGDNPSGEIPAYAVDNVLTTKWLDFNKLPLILDYGVAVTADGYRFATGGDATERDPVSWTVESSDDGVIWNEVDTKTDYPTTLSRRVYTPNILFQSPVPLTIVSFSTDRPKIGTGESANLQWTVVGSTSVSIDQGVGTVPESGSATITPSSDTTYTITATKGAETVTSQVSVKIISAGSHTFQYFRFTPVTLRGALANSIQLAEFQVLKSGIALPDAVASNPAGSSPVNEGVANLVDGNTATKWLDYNKSALILTFPAPVEVDGYRFATANDFDERDPIDWTFEGSSDGTTWTQLDSVTGFPTPLARLTYIGSVPLTAVLPPSISTFTAAPAHLLAGQSTTLTWNTQFATSVVIAPAVPNGTDLNGTASVTPAAPASYTLTASNTAGTATRTVQVYVEGPARQVSWKFFRFTPLTLRNGTTANSVQISEFELSLAGTPVTGATATNPGGDNPAGETPEFAVDGNTGTKWLDRNKGPLVLEFPSSVTIDSYRIATANDSAERDPFSWSVEGSDDGTTWSPIDSRDIGYVVPVDRFTYTNYFHFAGSTGEKTLVPVTQIVYSAANENLVLTWDSEAGRSYRVEKSSDLQTWDTAVANVPSAGTTTSQAVSLNGDRLYFQVVRKP